MPARFFYALLATLTLSSVPAAGQVKGTVLDAAGKPAAGAQIWTDDPRVGARADAKGSFTLATPPSGGVYAAAGNAVGAGTLQSGKLTLRLERAEPLSAAARRELGRRLLTQVAEAAGENASELRIIALALTDPAAARRLARSDGDKVALLTTLAARSPENGLALAAEADALSDNWARCRAGEAIAFACLEKKTEAARRAFETVQALWDGQAVGGNDLLFPYAALALRLASSPEKCEAIVANADWWAQHHPKPHEERTTLALALARVQHERGNELIRQLPSPYDAIGLLKLAAVAAPAHPDAALSYLQEADRRRPKASKAEGGFLSARDEALKLLLPKLAQNRPEAAHALVKVDPPTELTLAWRLRFEPSQTVQETQVGLRFEILRAQVAAPENRRALLGPLRTRFFRELSEAPLDVGDVIAFARLIAPLDSASARAALERSWRDRGAGELAAALAALDARRAVALADALENPDAQTAVRVTLGLLLNPTKLAPSE